MPIVPDTKDWTWVLERTCPECNFDVRGFPRDEIGSMIRAAEFGVVRFKHQLKTLVVDIADVAAIFERRPSRDTLGTRREQRG